MTKEHIYQPKLFFRFHRQVIRNRFWAKLPSSAKSVLPVIGRHTNKSGETWLSQETIAREAGLSRNTAAKGIQSLKQLPMFYVLDYRRSPRHWNVGNYQINPAPNVPGAAFFFHHSIVDSGTWAALHGSAHALYVVMRYFAVYDYYEYVSEGDEGDVVEEERFENVFYEFVPGDADARLLRTYAGISRRSFFRAKGELNEVGLIEDLEEPLENGARWKVYRFPPSER
jgi:hypothetical protein